MEWFIVIMAVCIQQGISLKNFTNKKGNTNKDWIKKNYHEVGIALISAIVLACIVLNNETLNWLYIKTENKWSLNIPLLTFEYFLAFIIGLFNVILIMLIKNIGKLIQNLLINKIKSYIEKISSKNKEN